MARPTKLTPEVEERILTAIRAGNGAYVAAQYAGIDRATFHRWMERGHPRGTERADARFRSLRARVEEARAAAEVRDVAITARAAETDWRAAAWRLSRRAPARHGLRAVEEALPEAPGASEQRWDLRRLSDEELDQLRRLGRRARGPQTP